MSYFLAICSNIDILEKSILIKKLLYIFLIVLLIFSMIPLLKSILKKEIKDKYNQNIKYLKLSISICLLIFGFAFVTKYSFPDLSECINVNQKYIDKQYVKKIEKEIYSLSEQNDYLKYDSIKKDVSNIKNDFIRKDYENRLIKFKKMINFNINFNNNFAGNIYMGDSRTTALVNILDENEQMVAKSGARFEHYLNHAKTVNEILKDNDNTYNIILNYGVNDLDNIDKYCEEYNNFLLDISKKHRIYIVSVYPVNDETKIRETKKVLNFNKVIKSCTKNIKNLTYCDLYNSVSHQEWIDKYMAKDGLHFNDNGNKYIHDEILKCINN